MGIGELISLIAGITGLVAAGASGIGAGVSAGKKARDLTMQRRFEKEQAKQEEKTLRDKTRDYNKDARKAAISRAIGSETVMMPRMQTMPQRTTYAPTPGNDVGGIVQGVAGGVGQLASGANSMFGANSGYKYNRG